MYEESVVKSSGLVGQLNPILPKKIKRIEIEEVEGGYLIAKRTVEYGKNSIAVVQAENLIEYVKSFFAENPNE